MITFLPDIEVQKADAEKKRLEPKNKFQFLWDAFFRNRKFKLTADEVKELTDIEDRMKKFRDGADRVWSFRNNAQDFFDQAVSRYTLDPSEDNFIRLLAHTYNPHTFHLMSRAGDMVSGWVVGETNKHFSPIVRRHLAKIHDSLVLEYREQEKHDQKSLARLEGIAIGGESQACTALRIQAENIQNLLDNGDLSNWRDALGAFLP